MKELTMSIFDDILVHNRHIWVCPCILSNLHFLNYVKGFLEKKIIIKE